ncbi:hypothetical protein CK227_10460 [Mesorhizobium sp. WSM4308]|uniref:hypothetical protein n=1 Tax=Mesorhizobium sp. WSM4308 TaxID=2029409 RepID=UPI000BAFB3A9|nr:hypothetical protein [Mesorhizobium sp. WSM4308]PBB75205.1 hypothetical protein CK227_10460 [Mesorhizobium sp. WSM4308]
MKSREQLVNRALQKLKVLAAGQSPSAEDYKVVDDDLEPVLSDLSSRGIYPFGNPDEIEDEAFLYLATCLAQSSAQDFGRDPDPNQVAFAEARLRELNTQKLSGQPLQVDYF